MSTLLSAAVLVDAAIALTLAECAALALYRWRTRQGVPLREAAATLAAGLCLMLAVRAAVHGSEGLVIAGWLMAAGIAHSLDMRARWTRRHVSGVTSP